eukprot:TRINITY_DN56197_c0_g1_i1.p1 TRINITY_DN56197_c0_g1~~TRINITY_DN56197_c0_g1_i1.p1  ORF type:complete len:233 (+),score=20.16 TRINITY_DN56197_c0_g1_i1:72-770(+)
MLARVCVCVCVSAQHVLSLLVLAISLLVSVVAYRSPTDDSETSTEKGNGRIRDLIVLDQPEAGVASATTRLKCIAFKNLQRAEGEFMYGEAAWKAQVVAEHSSEGCIYLLEGKAAFNNDAIPIVGGKETKYGKLQYANMLLPGFSVKIGDPNKADKTSTFKVTGKYKGNDVILEGTHPYESYFDSSGRPRLSDHENTCCPDYVVPSPTYILKELGGGEQDLEQEKKDGCSVM